MLRTRLAGLAALCAFAALAALGPATASATRLCSVKMAMCPAVNRWGGGTALVGEVSAPFQIVTGNGNMNCKKSKISGEITNVGGGGGVSVAAEITGFTFGECMIGAVNCTTATAVGLPYPVEFDSTAEFNGTMKFSPEWKFTCGTKLECLYTAPGTKLTVTGAKAAEIGASGLGLMRQGNICTTTSNLNTNYFVSSPGPMFVTNE
jgi:hypothetical protein